MRSGGRARSVRAMQHRHERTTGTRSQIRIAGLASGWLLAFAAASAGPARAQLHAGTAAADSSSVARAHFSVAVNAMRGGDLGAARSALERASSAWPGQEAYIWYRAVIGARQRDTAAVIAALEEYARLGLGRDLRDTTFDPFREVPAFARLAETHRANRTVLARSQILHTLDDSTMWPEAVDADAVTGKLYVSSIRRRTIIEVDRHGHQRVVIPTGTAGVGSVMGVRVGAGGVLWATTVGMRAMDNWPAGDTTAALLQIRIADGAVLHRFPLDPADTHIPGDLAVAPNGDVFVTDSRAPYLYWLRAGADTLEPITNPLFRSLQGVAVGNNPGIVFLADYSHGLLRLDLASQAVTRISEPARTTTLGIDGIALRGNDIIAVQNGVSPARIMRYQLDATGIAIARAEVLDRNWKIADEPTIGTIVGDRFVYVANSQWEQHAPDGTPRPDARLRPPVLLALPLPIERPR